jgi:hypothetical protein
MIGVASTGEGVLAAGRSVGTLAGVTIGVPDPVEQPETRRTVINKTQEDLHSIPKNAPRIIDHPEKMFPCKKKSKFAFPLYNLFEG